MQEHPRSSLTEPTERFQALFYGDRAMATSATEPGVAGHADAFSWSCGVSIAGGTPGNRRVAGS